MDNGPPQRSNRRQQGTYDVWKKKVSVGKFFRLTCVSKKLMGLVSAARAALQAELTRKLKNPRHDHTGSRGLRAAVELLSTQGLAYHVEGPRENAPTTPRCYVNLRAYS